MSIFDLPGGTGVITLNWRWDVVTPGGGSTIGEVHPTPQMTISNDSTAQVPRRVSGFQLDHSDAANINPLVDRISPVIVLPDGSEYRLGVYLFGSQSALPSSRGDVMRASLQDETSLLDENTGEPFGVDVDSYPSVALTEILGEAGIVNFEVVPDMTSACPDPIGWPAGTPRRTIANELCELLGYWPPFPDNNGVVRCGSPDSVDVPRLMYESGSLSRFLVGSRINETSVIGAPNVFEVVNNGATPSGISARFAIPDEYPHSVANINREIVARVEMQGIASTYAAARIARIAAEKDLSARTRLSFQTLVDPRHDTHSFIDVDGEWFREMSWSIDVANSTMTHQLQGMVVLA